MENTKLIARNKIEKQFIFAQEISNIAKIQDEEGQELGFHRSNNGNSIIFMKDDDGIDVAVEHCGDGSKIFHISKDSKGLPAMHEFRTDGTELMYLLTEYGELEKIIEYKVNGDKLTYWVYPNDEIIIQEQRQTGGIIFRQIMDENEALIWLHCDGSVETFGHEELLLNLQVLFHMYLA
jgi:hypothetical protein